MAETEEPEETEEPSAERQKITADRIANRNAQLAQKAALKDTIRQVIQEVHSSAPFQRLVEGIVIQYVRRNR